MTAAARKKAPALKVIHGGGEDAWYRKLAELLDGDAWKLADTLLEEYTLEDYPLADGVNNGLQAALREDEEMLRRRFGIIATAGYLGVARATAVTWPPRARARGVPFSVHRKMRGEKAHAEMAKRLRQAEREGYPLTVKMLARFRADEDKKPGKPYNERMKKAIAAAVKREMLGGTITKREDWWMAKGIGEASRDVAVTELRALASAIAKGDK